MSAFVNLTRVFDEEGLAPSTRDEFITNLTSIFTEQSGRLGTIDGNQFDQFLAAVLSKCVRGQRAEQFRNLRIDDLFIAFSAAHGGERAVAELEQILKDNCARWIRTTGSDPADVMQQVLVHLLVAEDNAPRRLLDYQGVAPLTSYLRVICTRTAISAARKTLAESSLSLSFEAMAPGNNVEFEALRARFREPFAIAMREAMMELAPRSKALLKMHYGKGVEVAVLAKMYDIHRVSMSRWLSEAKEELFASVRERFKKLVAVSDSEFQSMLHIMRSELDLRLSSLRESELP